MWSVPAQRLQHAALLGAVRWSMETLPVDESTRGLQLIADPLLSHSEGFSWLSWLSNPCEADCMRVAFLKPSLIRAAYLQPA